MDLTIDLNDHVRGVTVEVGDKAIQHLLTAKPQAVEAISAQMVPQDALSLRHLPPRPT